MTKATDHLRGMLQREDLGAFDKNALREVLDEHQTCQEKLDEIIVHGGQALACSKPVQVAYKERDRDARHLTDEKECLDLYIVELQEKICHAELEVIKAHEARDAAREKARTAGSMIAMLKAQLKALHEAGAAARTVLARLTWWHCEEHSDPYDRDEDDEECDSCDEILGLKPITDALSTALDAVGGKDDPTQ